MYMSKIFNVLHFKQLEEIENKSKVEFKEIDPLDRGTASINSSNPPLEPYLLLRYIPKLPFHVFIDTQLSRIYNTHTLVLVTCVSLRGLFCQFLTSMLSITHLVRLILELNWTKCSVQNLYQKNCYSKSLKAFH